MKAKEKLLFCGRFATGCISFATGFIFLLFVLDSQDILDLCISHWRIQGETISLEDDYDWFILIGDKNSKINSQLNMPSEAHDRRVSPQPALKHHARKEKEDLERQLFTAHGQPP